MRRIIPAIVEEHAEEAAFLWLLRDRSVSAPHLGLRELARLDDRVDAHIDGLRVAGQQGWDIWRAALDYDEPGEVFARSFLAFDYEDWPLINGMLALAESRPPLARAIVSALGWLRPDRAQPFIDHLTASASPLARRIGIGGAAAHRLSPGKVLEASLDQVDYPALTSRALRAVGELGVRRLTPALLPHFDAEHPDVRFSAAWSAALLGERSAIRVLGAFAVEQGPYAWPACMVGLRSLPPADACRAHGEIADRPELARLAVSVVGIIGDPALMDWLFEAMRVPELARLAGESFVSITGAGIEHPDLVGSEPEGFREQPSEDPEDANVEMDPDEHLVWPNPSKLGEWWRRYRGDFRAGTRYMLGSPITPDWMRDVLRGGRQRQRAAAALELALERRGQPLFEVRAPGFRQQQVLNG